MEEQMLYREADKGNKQVIFKNCIPFTDCISEIINTQIDQTKSLDVMMPMYNLIEYSGNYSKTAGSCFSYIKGIWQYYRY